MAERSWEPGLIVRLVELELTNVALPTVAPLIDTTYKVGVATEIAPGIVNVTRRVAPTIVVTAEAAW